MNEALPAALAEAKEREAQLRHLGDNLPDSMVYQLTDEGGGRRFLHVSAGVERLCGVTPAAVLADAQLLYGMIVAEDRAEVAKREAESAATLTPFHAVVRLRRADGEVRWHRLCSTPRRAPAGGLIWDGLATDITERREVERERERLAWVLDNHFDAAYWVDETGRIVYLNESGAACLGYRREELLGQPVGQVSPRATPERWTQVWRELRAEGRKRFETFHRTKDGRELAVEVVSTLVRVDGRELSCAFARDCSERHAAERAIRDQMAELRRWQQLILDREDRILDLKARVNALSAELGRTAPYPHLGSTVRPDAGAGGA